MQIGPLSEWVTAFAEIIAVSVALFLPMITSAREDRRRQKKFKNLIQTLTKKSLLGDKNAKRELAAFIRTAIYITKSAKEDDIIQIGVQINDLLQHDSLDSQTKQDIEELLHQLL